MQQYIYLLINFFTVIICFIFSFHHKIRFSRYFSPFLTASLIVGAVFVAWDAWFTKIGVWWFNDKYLLGIRLFGLPLEELLFFICIPFACIFTYYCLDKFFKLDWKPLPQKIFVLISIFGALLISSWFCDRIYTFITFLSTGCSLFILYFILKVKWIGKVSFVYLLLMPGFLMVNGILTGTGLESPVVNYNPEHFIGLRILTIPVEDVVYGYELILWNVFLFELFRKNEEKTVVEVEA
ncbi:lycopene cyclase domain-containing protein [Chryseobacterium taichungense]|uniref:lycopene cyclase domain-containing protein n=1 Tax=Chryseobacterium taichungense TaxID=295069 RepID=UPI0028AB0535|nr:lycopene cyclase domain-containing protein [Chryseobacterium taichungense]